MEKEQQPSSEGGASVAQRRRGMTVEASPLNPVKLELGVVLVLALLLWLIHDLLLEDKSSQLLLLLGSSLAGMGWLIWRARSILRAIDAEADEGQSRGEE